MAVRTARPSVKSRHEFGDVGVATRPPSPCIARGRPVVASLTRENVSFGARVHRPGLKDPSIPPEPARPRQVAVMVPVELAVSAWRSRARPLRKSAASRRCGDGYREKTHADVRWKDRPRLDRRNPNVFDIRRGRRAPVLDQADKSGSATRSTGVCLRANNAVQSTTISRALRLGTGTTGFSNGGEDGIERNFVLAGNTGTPGLPGPPGCSGLAGSCRSVRRMGEWPPR